jgi:hypothetical protein
MNHWVLYAGAIAASVVALGTVARVLYKILRRVTDLADDLLGEPARPGVPARPALSVRVASMETAVVHLDARVSANTAGMLANTASVRRLEQQIGT